MMMMKLFIGNISIPRHLPRPLLAFWKRNRTVKLRGRRDQAPLKN